ncbi:hypothetical protein J6590_075425 [Homalodisca vitripennis]|nr:hypothetical protein J6590_075425 [Homalodisca vitripennis]
MPKKQVTICFDVLLPRTTLAHLERPIWWIAVLFQNQLSRSRPVLRPGFSDIFTEARASPVTLIRRRVVKNDGPGRISFPGPTKAANSLEVIHNSSPVLIYKLLLMHLNACLTYSCTN